MLLVIPGQELLVFIVKDVVYSHPTSKYNFVPYTCKYFWANENKR